MASASPDLARISPIKTKGGMARSGYHFIKQKAEKNAISKPPLPHKAIAEIMPILPMATKMCRPVRSNSAMEENIIIAISSMLMVKTSL
jgi:hypothetical protein